MKERLLQPLTGILLLALAACATTSTRVTSSWKRPDYSGRPQKILAVAIENNEGAKEQFENDFTDDLKQHGVTVIPSYTVITSTGMPDKETLIAAVKESGVDSILTTRLVEQENLKQYVPGSYSPAYDDFWRYYAYSYGYVYTPGYTVTNKVVVMQTNLYDAATQKLLWSATSDTSAQGSSSEVIDSFIRTITGKMVRDGLVSK